MRTDFLIPFPTTSKVKHLQPYSETTNGLRVVRLTIKKPRPQLQVFHESGVLRLQKSKGEYS